MKSKYINGTINKDIYLHADAETLEKLSQAEEDIQNLEERKQDKLTAGENITISEDNVISATGGIDPEQLVTVITAEATDEQVPSAKAVWNQAAKYAKAKRFIGTSTKGGNLYLQSNNIADIYNAIHFGNQTVFIYDTFTEIEYRVTYCFIDNTDPSAQRIVVYAESSHVDTDNSINLGITENYVDHLYVKASANSNYLIPYTSTSQDKLVAGENIDIENNVISATGSDNTIVMPESVYNQITSGQTEITPSDECWEDAQEFFSEITNAISTDNRAQIQIYYWEHNDEDNTNALANTVYQVVAAYSSPEDENSENLIIQIRGVAFNGSIANGTSLELVDNQLVFGGSDVSLVDGFIASNSLNLENGIISGSGSGGSGTGEVKVAIFDLSATVNESHQPTVINIGLSEQSIGGDTSEIEQQIEELVSDITSIESNISSIQTALNNKQNKLIFDNTPTSGSSNPVTSNGVYNALSTKQNVLTFDSTPTSGSNNPVTSGGVYGAIVQSDWSNTNTLSKAYIANKPGMYQYYDSEYQPLSTLYNIQSGTTNAAGRTYDYDRWWVYSDWRVGSDPLSGRSMVLVTIDGNSFVTPVTHPTNGSLVIAQAGGSESPYALSRIIFEYGQTTYGVECWREEVDMGAIEYNVTIGVLGEYALYPAHYYDYPAITISSYTTVQVVKYAPVPDEYLPTTEKLSNKVTSLSSTSTDTEYPSAKCVYDMIGDVETLLSNI